MSRVRLTTIGNPYNPFTEFDHWYDHDCNVLGYNSSAYLARIAHTSDAFTDYENEMEIERAIDEIIELDPFNIYRKVSEDEQFPKDELMRDYEKQQKSVKTGSESIPPD